MPTFGLLIEAAELDVQNRALPFAEPVIGSINEMAVEPLAGHAAAVVHGAGLALKFIVIGNDHSAFAGGHQLACLKAERACDTEGSYTLSPPLGGVGMR